MIVAFPCQHHIILFTYRYVATDNGGKVFHSYFARLIRTLMPEQNHFYEIIHEVTKES